MRYINNRCLQSRLGQVRLGFALFACAGLLAGADLGPDLVAAAKKGQVERVRSLLEKGAALESKDKDGRTALMLAAEHGHAAVARLLFENGASATARDRQGWTAYSLALLSSAGGRDQVLKLLPPPQRQHMALEPVLVTENLYSSCFMSLPELPKYVAEIRPEALVLSAVRGVAAAPGVPAGAVPIDFVASDGNAIATLRVRPHVSCAQPQSSDNVSLAIDLRVTVTDRQQPVLEKTFGGGLKGLHARKATSPAQYQGLFAEWAKTHSAPIYWAIVAALLKAAP